MEKKSTKQDFKKFLKYFSSRLVQTLVQSRLGDDIEQTCLPSPKSHDWFNMKIDEIGEITASLKASVQNFPPAGILVVEFLLYTAAGQYLPLESWILRVIDDKDDHNDDLTDFYHQMSTLLRSVAAASRMTPMHRLYVKKQSLDTFVVLYRISNQTEISDLGAKHKERRIGQLPSPHGTLCLDLWYRTKMHIDEPEISDENNKEKENEKSNDNHVPQRPSFADCVPLINEKKQEKNQVLTSPLSTTPSNQTSIGAGNTPKFILGQSTSSEDSRNSEQPSSLDNESRPSLAELRNQSFPFVSLLQSAYTPLSKEIKNESATEISFSANSNKSPLDENGMSKRNSPTDFVTTNTILSASKISEEKIEEVDEDDVMDMSKSEDSFVELCDFGTNSNSYQTEIGELIKQLRTAPEILENYTFYWNSEKELGSQLSMLNSQKEEFEAFVDHINSIAE